MGRRPAAELLAIVGADDHGIRRARGKLAQIGECLLRLLPGNQITERLAVRKYPQQLALVLAQVITGQVLLLQAGLFEMVVVEDGVFNAGGGDVADEVLLPDALGHPHAANARGEQVLQVLREGADLADAIAARDHGQDRLIEAAAHDLDLPAGDELAQTLDIIRPPVHQPFHQRAARVQGKRNLGVLFHELEERSVAVPVGLFEHAVEVADGLVVVKSEDEA